MLNWIEEIVKSVGGFLKSYIYPLATPFFAILNCVKIDQLLTEWNSPTWFKSAALLLSVVYFLFAFGIGIYWIIKNVKPASGN